MKIHELVALLLVLAAAPAQAAEYRVGPGSELGFTAKITASSFAAKSSAVSGTLSWDPATGQLGSGVVVLKASGLETGMETRDEHLREKYLEAEKFPEVRFEAVPQTIALQPGAPVKLRGAFVIKGVRKEAELPLTIERNDAAGITLTARFPLDITHYGIPQPKFAVVKMETVIDANAKLLFVPAAK